MVGQNKYSEFVPQQLLKEIFVNRTLRIILAVIILGFGAVVIAAFIGVIDIAKMAKEYRHEQRLHALPQSPGANYTIPLEEPIETPPAK